MSTNYGNTGSVITDMSTSGVAMFASMKALPAGGTLNSVSIRRGTTAGSVQPRLALYKGGLVTNPTGATLVHDFGQLTGTTPSALETYTASSETLNTGDILHVFIKMGSSATSVGVTNADGAGDFYNQDMGSCLNGQVSADPTVSFPGSISGINGLDQGIQTPCFYITYTAAPTTPVIGGIVARQHPLGRGPQMQRSAGAFKPSYGSNIGRQVLLQLFSFPGTPLANTTLNFWTALDEASAAIDGPIQLTTDAAGYVLLQNLKIAAIVAQVRCAVPGDPTRSRNFTVQFV